jgi:hypothetical protein
MYYLLPQFLPHKYDAMNMITVDIPEEPLRKYMNEKHRKGHTVSHMALIMTAYLHMAAEFPCVNRFIVNRKIYQHDDFTISLVVLRPGTVGNDDTMGKLHLDFTDTVFDVQRKIDEYITVNTATEQENSLDKAMRVFCKMNGILRVVVGLVRWVDRNGLLPKSLIDISPFHASLLMSNLASIRTNHIYHHVYDFGTTSVTMTMGNLHEVPKRGPDGTIVLERCLPLGIVMDERIASGHYLGLAFSRVKELLANPELLESPGVLEPVAK